MAESEFGTLPKNQARAIVALLAASTVDAAAVAAGVSERSLRRWMQTPDFRYALAAAEDSLLDSAVRSAVGDLADNRRVLRAIRDDPDMPPSVRVRAALGMEDSLLRWRELRGLEARLLALEAAAVAVEEDFP